MYAPPYTLQRKLVNVILYTRRTNRYKNIAKRAEAGGRHRPDIQTNRLDIFGCEVRGAM